MSDFITLIRPLYKYRRLVLSKRFGPVVAALFMLLGVRYLECSAWVWGPMTFLAASFLLRSLVVLPHEKQWLDKCASLIKSYDYRAAEVCLRTTPVLVGAPAQIQWALKKVQLFATTNDLVKAHEAVQQLKKLALLAGEQHKCRLAEATIYYRSGNYRRFSEMLGKVDKETLSDAESKAQYHFLSGFNAEIAGDYAAAKAEIECLLEEDINGTRNASVYNNLARLDDLQGNELQAVHYYEKARDLLRSQPAANLYPVVYHNLIMHLARAGNESDAKAVLEEYRAAIDTRVTPQYLEYLNNQIHLARQLKDLPMLLSAYALIDLRIKPKLKQDEWMAQFVSELRTRANDQIGLNEHLIKTELLFDELTRLPFPKDYFALKEVFGVLRPLADTNQLGPMRGLFERTLSALSAIAPKIDAFRKTIPDALLEPHFYWISQKIELHKLTPTTPADYKKAFFDSLFGQLQELARITADKDNSRLQIHALVMLCDEYAAYAARMNSQFGVAYQRLAQESLQEANRLLQSRSADRALFEFMIGLAWCEWRINASAERASYWVNLFEAKNISLRHYAGWLGQKHAEVKDWLNKQ